MPWTNRGKFEAVKVLFQGQAAPTNFFARLFTNATAPTVDTNLTTDAGLTEIANGNGYVAGTGIQLTRNATDFENAVEDDTNDWGQVEIKDLVWTASGGPIPASGNGARWLLLCGAAGAANVWMYFDLVSDRTVSDGQPLTIADAILRLAEA